MPIPADAKSAGKVNVKVQGRLTEYAAVSRHGARLATGAKVKVIGLADQMTLVVAPLGKNEDVADAASAAITEAETVYHSTGDSS